MNTCDTCEHWDDKTVGERDEVRHDGYAPKRYCMMIGSGNLPDENSVEAAAQGIGGAALTTGPKFGCIHHTPKP